MAYPITEVYAIHPFYIRVHRLENQNGKVRNLDLCVCVCGEGGGGLQTLRKYWDKAY